MSTNTKITAQMVKELRERTQAGMMECKKALVECDGDIDKAVEEMRKSGMAKADKKASRVAAEGLVNALVDEQQKNAVIVEVNCETDFVARDENFVNFVNYLLKYALDNNINDVAELLASKDSDTDETLDEKRKNLISKVGENVNVRRMVRLSVENEGCIGGYTHGNKIGVLVSMKNSTQNTAKDIAMHIAATSPLVVDASQVPEELVAKEKEIFVAQAKESGKPDNIIEKMVAGRIAKYVNEILSLIHI